MRPVDRDSRPENLERLAADSFDLLVVGGGVSGAGCALDAASRGMRVALVDKGDFASGTSSKSSKLVHGGLRYLAQYEFGLTWEAAHERDLLSRLAPHLVRPVRFFYPVFRKGTESRFAAVGLTVYDALSALRGVPRHRRAKPPTVRALAPTLDASRLVAAWTYWDAMTDDARLVWELLRASRGFGAVFANHVRVESFERGAHGRVAAAAVRDERTGGAFTIRARAVINATGVWAGEVGALDGAPAEIAIRPAKGIHLVVPASRLPVGSAAIVPSAARDRRSLFAIPWGERVVLGTTDTEYDGPLDAPGVTSDDAAYVLAGVNKWLGVELSDADVVGAWAGLRPLRAGAAATRTADLSRRHAIGVGASGLISVTGGKLTTYRRMAADAVDAACALLGESARSRTHRLRFGLTKPRARVAADVADLLAEAGAAASAMRLVEQYGDLAPSVAAIAAADPALAKPVADGLDITGAEVAFAVRHEMAVSLEDALSRRTRLALLDKAGGLDGPAAGIVARESRWDDEAAASERARFADRLASERGPVVVHPR